MTHDTHTTLPPPHTHTPHPHIWGDVKKTSPMEGEVFFTGDRRPCPHTRGHRDSMTESAQWADSVKKKKNILYSNPLVFLIPRLQSPLPSASVRSTVSMSSQFCPILASLRLQATQSRSQIASGTASVILCTVAVLYTLDILFVYIYMYE